MVKEYFVLLYQEAGYWWSQRAPGMPSQ